MKMTIKLWLRGFRELEFLVSLGILGIDQNFDKNRTSATRNLDTCKKKLLIADDNKYHNPKKQRTSKTGFFISWNIRFSQTSDRIKHRQCIQIYLSIRD